MPQTYKSRNNYGNYDKCVLKKLLFRLFKLEIKLPVQFRRTPRNITLDRAKKPEILRTVAGSTIFIVEQEDEVL